ncbi:ImmA/IrrE family metallo-endopeptidase [Entomobacter blattae]|uniref:IrrE N-terminal-like domain-containing protein n=1 Tax=Entomobacter blattae TaxID=2762277 RepID=A0A7H1NR79_9PROT|nr:ImmA/IrrE family metallo-endopeptidase [Entomobacter blattae]QNT78289.1 hypothetical protein JGUZn3_10610 [Entomobacter blattae]
MEDYSTPKPSGLLKRSIREITNIIIEKFKLKPGDNLLSLVHDLNGTVSIKDIYDGNPDSILIEADSSFIIFISGITGPRRDRFTIAHELGHLFLHFLPEHSKNNSYRMRATRWVDEEDSDQRRAEREANIFAAELLMPKERFIGFFEENKIDTTDNASIVKVSDYFGVSLSAAKVRVSSLGL